ncbi:MAG TPA: aldehyde dehydrogenase [Modestobacter sp.]|nr:aldehyde dehydrogenase [Modestobacter sp.]
MRIHGDVFIGGSWRTPATGQVIDVVSPATEELIGQVPDGAPADVDAAVAAARLAFDHGEWPRLSPAERATALGRLSAAVKRRSEEFADLISAQVGSPRAWATIGQVGVATAVLDTYTRLAETHPWESDRRGAFGTTVRVRQLPVGVVAAIVPWNAPLFVAALKLGPALAAGCTVVLKPSPEAPLDAYLLAEAVLEAGLPDGVVNIVPAGAAASEHLVRHPGVDKVSFTGSTAVGRRIGALCGADVRRCTLELGGKSAAILLDDVDLDRRLLDGLVTGSMANNGQICVSQTRILAPRARYADVVEALAARVGELTVGDPADPATEVGPLVSQRARESVLGHLAAAVADGARPVTGGGRPVDQPRGWYIEPTVFAGVDNGMRIAREEVFGPVAVVIPYDDEDDAVAIANDSEYGLAGSVWTGDPERGVAVAGRVRTGSVSVNSAAPLDLGSPFGGFKLSGIGREGGPEAFSAYTELQSVIMPRPRTTTTA